MSVGRNICNDWALSTDHTLRLAICYRMASVSCRRLLYGQRHHPRPDRIERRVIRASEMARNIDHHCHYLQRHHVQHVSGSQAAVDRRHPSRATHLWSLCHCGAIVGHGSSSSGPHSALGLSESRWLGFDGSCSTYRHGDSVERSYRLRLFGPYV